MSGMPRVAMLKVKPCQRFLAYPSATATLSIEVSYRVRRAQTSNFGGECQVKSSILSQEFQTNPPFEQGFGLVGLGHLRVTDQLNRTKHIIPGFSPPQHPHHHPLH
jgi:hypothetical protein